MSQLSVAQPRRALIAYAALSALVVWHALAMLVAALPDGALAQAVRPPFHAYLTLLRLDNKWGFFAPNVPKGFAFRYAIEDASGERHAFTPGDQWSRFHPGSLWFKDHYKTIMMAPEVHGDAAAARFCREHAALNPVSVTLMEAEQKDFWPADWLAGKRPFDPDFLIVRTLKTVPCPAKRP